MEKATFQERGTVLIVSLLLLVVVTLLGITGMKNITLEEKMAGNALDRNAAFQAAESALREGEGWLRNLAEKPVRAAAGTACGGFDCVWDKDELQRAIGLGPNDDMSYADDRVWQLNTGPGVVRLQSNLLVDVTSQPQYTVEFLKYVRDSMNMGQHEDVGKTHYRGYYRIAARGQGRATGRAHVCSTYARRF